MTQVTVDATTPQPAKLYRPWRRAYPPELEDPVYPRHFTPQRAYPNGVITVRRAAGAAVAKTAVAGAPNTTATHGRPR